MKRPAGRRMATLALLSLAPGISLAHHAFAAQYDETKPVALTGVVVKIEWLNPHAYFFIDVRDDDGVITTWACELTSPVGLMRLGWAIMLPLSILNIIVTGLVLLILES